MINPPRDAMSNTRTRPTCELAEAVNTTCRCLMSYRGLSVRMVAYLQSKKKVTKKV